MSVRVKINWKEEMCFDAEINGHNIILDAHESFGGKNQGPSPKPLLLVGLGGCTGMDVISILKKMKVFPEDLSIDVEAQMTEEHPKIYDKIHIKYIFKGKSLPISKIEKAVNLSQEKYCGVTAMLEKCSKITHEILLED